MLGGTPIKTTPDFLIQSTNTTSDLFQAYLHDTYTDVWLINPGSFTKNFTVDLSNLYIDSILLADNWQGPGEILGTSAFESTPSISIYPNKDGFTIAGMKSDSVTHIRFANAVAVPEPANILLVSVCLCACLLRRSRAK